MGAPLDGVGVCSHRGRRRSNQDAVVATELSRRRELVAVADGMGGQRAGEVASARALEVLVAELDAGTGLREAVQAANTAVHAEATDNPEHQGMGTTLVALLRDGNTYHVANVGDSRAYRVWADGIEQITADHSFVAEAVESGSMTLEQAAVSPWRNALTRAIGTDANLQVDVFGPFPADSPHVLLLCSDGLYKAVTEELIREYVLSTADVGAAAEALAALAFRRGSDDNISVAALEFGSLSRHAPMNTIPFPIPRQQAIARNGESRPAPPTREGEPPSADADRASRRGTRSRLSSFLGLIARRGPETD